MDASNSSENENLCCVCFKNVDIYSIGVCDHPVCFECSTRMRVLCKQNECPICRQDMPKVIFTRRIEPFGILFPRLEKSSLQDRKFGLYFRTSDIQKAYFQLLEHRCQMCENQEERKWPFKTFQQLKDHMRREHELFYCDICVDNLKIFTFERRCYTRQELGHHRRKGDPDNTSHRGHPLCEFCDTRYMDNDELFRHLRRTHFFCHLCDADGKHQYYSCVDDLMKHFKEEHYLCEEGECRSVPLTAVFRTNIDLKAHVATEHSRHMSKSANKQARTLELEFTLAPRPRPDNNRNRRYDNRRFDGDLYDEPGGGPGGGGGEGPSGRLFVNPLTSQDFPALGSTSGSVTLRPASVNFSSRHNSNFTQEDFPSLGGSRGSSAVTITTNTTSTRSNRPPEVTITRTVRGQGSGRRNDNFSTLGSSGLTSSSGGSTVRLSVNSQDSHAAPKVSIHVNHQGGGNSGITTHITTTSASSASSTRPSEAFPALASTGNASKPSQPQWVQVKSKKQESKQTKVNPAPTLPPSDLQQFPSLQQQQQRMKKGNSTQLTGGGSNGNWVNLNSMNSAIARSREAEARNEARMAAAMAKQQHQQAENIDNKGKKKKKGKEKLEGKTTKTEQNFSIDRESNNNEDINKNGMVKKRSEIKIENLNNAGEPSSVSSSRIEAGGDPKPPPGFTLSPPPGLSPSAFPTFGGIGNDLQFTSSSGKTYSITPQIKYRAPDNFQQRNLNLVKKVMEILDCDTIKEFKTYSDLFRKGGFPTENYYQHCKQVLGDKFEDVFPELLVLLPDIDQQQELYRVYDGKNKNNLVSCENCKQVIFRKELSDHYTYHVLDNQFPSLDSERKSDVGGSSAWKRPTS